MYYHKGGDNREIIISVISLIFVTLFITIFVLDCKKDIDVSGKGYSFLLMIAMPLAIGLNFLDINTIKLPYTEPIRLVLSILIIVFSIMLFAKLNAVKRRNRYNSGNVMSKLVQKLIYGIIFSIIYSAAFFYALALINNKLMEDRLLEDMIQLMNDYPILAILFVFFMLYYFLYVISVFISFAGVFLFGFTGWLFSYIMLLLLNSRSCSEAYENTAAKVIIILLSIIPVINILISIILLFRLIYVTKRKKNNNKVACMQ